MRSAKWFFYGVPNLARRAHLTTVGRANKQVVEATATAGRMNKKCPDCAELIRPEAIFCRYCGGDLKEPPSPAT